MRGPRRPPCGVASLGHSHPVGIYWNKLSPGRSNVNSTTSSALSDMGGGATFFDNLVEVRAVDDATTEPPSDGRRPEP